MLNKQRCLLQEIYKTQGLELQTFSDDENIFEGT